MDPAIELDDERPRTVGGFGCGFSPELSPGSRIRVAGCRCPTFTGVGGLFGPVAFFAVSRAPLEKLETYRRDRGANAAGPAGLDHCLGLRASARSRLGGCRARG